MMMLEFLWKGVIRDRRRSLLPIIVVSLGVFFVVFIDGFIAGMLSNMTQTTATYETGHLKVMTRAYEQEEKQQPIDLALLDIDRLMAQLEEEFPEVDWTPRVLFGGLLDVPDVDGTTKVQGPVSATAYDLLSSGSHEAERLRLPQSLVAGEMIRQEGELLISYDFAQNYQVKPGDEVTFFGTTMYGSMSFSNFRVAGIIRFGMSVLDRGAVVMDLRDAQQLTDMENGASEICGFLSDERYDREAAERIKVRFNAQQPATDEYAPVMKQLADQQMMSQTLAYTENMTLIMITLLVLALSIVLWNTGLLGGIRRYNEFGVRIALGEEKGALYRTLLLESLLIGVIGSVAGTLLGLLLCYWLSIHGIDYGSIMDNYGMMIHPVIRAELRPSMCWIGFIPGVLSMLIGTALAGQAVFKRETANLFKELD